MKLKELRTANLNDFEYPEKVVLRLLKSDKKYKELPEDIKFKINFMVNNLILRHKAEVTENRRIKRLLAKHVPESVQPTYDESGILLTH